MREYVADGVTPEQLAKGERRRMDCMDCHNRPSHAMAATPERAVNEAMARGDIPTTLPFVHREAVKALKATYPSQRGGRCGEFPARCGIFTGPQQPQVYMTRAAGRRAGGAGVQDLYRRNVFPDMNVRFGTYPNNIGHIDFPGCFRCHDDNHKSKDGKKIGQDCETCHAIE